VRLSDAAQVLIICLFLVLCYLGLLQCPGANALFAETNIQSNLIRISKYLHHPVPNGVIVGSSLSGRLLPEYFREEGLDVANLGLDGSRSCFGLEVLSRRPERCRLVLIEVNTLFMPKNSNEMTLQEAIANPTFRLGGILPAMDPIHRPSSLLYTLFKEKKDFTAGGGEAEKKTAPMNGSILNHLEELRAHGVEVISSIHEVGEDRSNRIQLGLDQSASMVTRLQEGKMIDDDGACAASLDFLFKERFPSSLQVKRYIENFQSQDISTRLKSLLEQGSKIVLFVIPTAKGEGGYSQAWEIAANLNIPLINIRDRLPDNGVDLRYSDGRHLIGPSARKVVHVLAGALKELGYGDRLRGDAVNAASSEKSP
jgi:hypothetical protein